MDANYVDRVLSHDLLIVFNVLAGHQASAKISKAGEFSHSRFSTFDSIDFGGLQVDEKARACKAPVLAAGAFDGGVLATTLACRRAADRLKPF